jgi:hypothetical protein
VEIVKSRREDRTDGGFGTALFVLAAMLLALLGFLLFRFGRGGQFNRLRIRMKLPQCDQCAKEGIPEPIHADFYEGELTFVVHREFRRRLIALNPGQRSAA